MIDETRMLADFQDVIYRDIEELSVKYNISKVEALAMLCFAASCIPLHVPTNPA